MADVKASKERPVARWIALGVTCGAGVLAAIQSSSLIVALVELVQELNATFANIIWVLLSFMLAVGAVSPVLGFFSDSGLKGVRCKLFNFGFAIFGVASLLCGFAQPQYNAIDLIFYRAIMGVGAGFIFSNSSPILADKFHPYGQMGLAQGIWQIAFALGSVIGPVVGGILLSAGWSWIFWFNVPFCVVGCSLGFWQVRDYIPPESAGNQRQVTFLEVMRKFDYFGAFLLLTSIICLFIAVVASIFPTPALGQTATIVFGSICGAFAFIFLFWDYYRRNNSPFVNFKLFDNRTFTLCAFGNVATSLARGGLTFSFIFLYQGPYGTDALQAGINVIPFGVGLILGGLPSGRIGDLYGYKAPSVIGPLVSAFGLVGAAFIRASTNYWITAVYLFFAGLGGGIYNSPTTALMMLSIKPSERGQSSGLRMMMAMCANAFSIVICFDLIVGNLDQALVYKLFIVGGGGLDDATLAPFMNGFHAVIWIVVACNLVASACSIPLKDLKRPKGGPVPGNTTTSGSSESGSGASSGKQSAISLAALPAPQEEILEAPLEGKDAKEESEHTKHDASGEHDKIIEGKDGKEDSDGIEHNKDATNILIDGKEAKEDSDHAKHTDPTKEEGVEHNKDCPTTEAAAEIHKLKPTTDQEQPDKHAAKDATTENHELKSIQVDHAGKDLTPNNEARKRDESDTEKAGASSSPEQLEVVVVPRT